MGTYRPSVANLMELGNFTQTFRWGVQVTKFPPMLSGFTSEDINFRCESHTIPEKTGETVSIIIRGSEKRQSGKHAYTSPLTMTMVTTTDGIVEDFLTQWGNLCWQSEDGSSGITQNNEDIEGTLTLFLLNNKDEPYRKFTMYGVTLETASRGDADGSTSDPFKPGLSLAFDYFIEEPM